VLCIQNYSHVGELVPAAGQAELIMCLGTLMIQPGMLTNPLTLLLKLIGGSMHAANIDAIYPYIGTAENVLC
jgi:hypothetical protein